MTDVIIRQAMPADVKRMKELIDPYVPSRRLLIKSLVTLFEDVQEFLIAEVDGDVVGCGALHVLWEDLAEIRTIAVSESHLRTGLGSAILDALIERARALGLQRLFCLTFETEFFGAHGFTEIEGTPVEPAVYEELLASYDDGVAEFLDLERVKPNTLGNVRMLRYL